jgi:hypothetical protein
VNDAANAAKRGVIRQALTAEAGLSSGGPFLTGAARAAALPSGVVGKDTGRGCRGKWIQNTCEAGFSVVARDSAGMAEIKRARARATGSAPRVSGP